MYQQEKNQKKLGLKIETQKERKENERKWKHLRDTTCGTCINIRKRKTERSQTCRDTKKPEQKRKVGTDER